VSSYISSKKNNFKGVKALFIIPTDAHNYKITRILKQSKLRPSLRHASVHAGTIIREPFFCLAKTTVWFYILVDYDVVNVMAAYQPVVWVCGVPHNHTTGWYAAMTLTTS
jgi:hypothetical protein